MVADVLRSGGGVWVSQPFANMPGTKARVLASMIQRLDELGTLVLRRRPSSSGADVPRRIHLSPVAIDAKEPR